MPQLDLGSVLGPQGPKGDPGNQGTVGPRGPQGEQGDAGKDATINGVNALQISVGQGLKESQEGGTYSIAMGDEDYKNLQNAKGAVRFDQAQTLTPAQQKQAQHNIGTTWPCNPNLLDNWYFGRPVNQKGGTEWLSSSSDAIPCVDRWNWWGQYKTGTRLNLLDDGLQLAKPTEGQGQGLYQSIVQHIEKTRVPVGATVTLSALVKAEVDASIILAINSSYNALSVQANVWELITFTLNAPSVEQNYDVSIQRNSGGIAFTVKAVKLELGPTQTLAHREGDKWVLNEVPDYGEQLRRCQRYYQKFDENVTLFYGNSGSSGGAGARLFLPTAVQMRTKPVTSPFVINVLPEGTIAGTNNITFTPSDVAVVPGGVCLYGAVSPSVSIGSYTYKAIVAQLRNAPLALSADL